MEFVILVIAGQLSSITVDRVEDIKASICRALGFKKSEVLHAPTVKDNENELYSQLRLKLPKIEKKINQLQMDALNKKSWLTDLGIVELTVKNKSLIKLAEKNKGDVTKQSENAENSKQPRSLLRVHSVLALNPRLKVHCDLTFDTILAIELPPTVDIRKRKAVLEQCESAMEIYRSHHKECFDVRLAAIRFGNHNVVPVRLPHQQQIAFVEKELSSDLNITSKMKPDAHCGGKENSGLADALKNVHSLRDKMSREATKLSIVICFITSNSANLEHYRCCFDYDVIDLGHALAADAIPLPYIIGIDLERRQTSSTEGQENHLLSGLTAITGGRYFQIQDISLLKELIHCIIKENNSIEKNMGAVNDVVITEIHKQYGDVNDVHLTECVHNRLRLWSCKIESITHTGSFLTPISQISERVSWADNLDDAIAGVKSLEEHMKAADKKPTPSRQAPMMKGRFMKAVPKEFVSVRLNPDMEVSARMVRRQIERSAYCRPTTEMKRSLTM